MILILFLLAFFLRLSLSFRSLSRRLFTDSEHVLLAADLDVVVDDTDLADADAIDLADDNDADLDDVVDADSCT